MKLSIYKKFVIKLSSKKRLLILGDSHTSVFSAPEFQNTLSKKFNCFIETVGGATISGLDNPNSKTNAKVIFERTYQQIKPDILIVQIGEVDTGFVLWYRAEKHKASVKTMLESCIENYRAFLTQYQGIDKTIVISAPLPTIRDDQDWGEIANLRKEVTASQIERTQLTIEFNNRIEEITKKMGIHYINLDAESVGDDGLVSNSLLNDNPNDHHYSKQAYLPLVIKHLKALL